MPYIVSGEPGRQQTDFTSVEHNYTYHSGLDMKPGSELHNRILAAVMQRAHESQNEMQKRYNSWNEIDRILTTYIPLKDKEKEIKEKDSRRPVSIIFPYTYSMLESLLTYMVMAFFQDPMFRYEGVGPEDVKGAILLELVIALHCIKSKVPLAVHTVLRDSLGYGLGIGIPTWIKRMGKVPIQTTVSVESSIGSSTSNEIVWIEDTIFEGNKLDNIDPYMWLPDPNYGAHDIQSSEFLGWIVKDNLMNLLAEERYGDGTLFNVKYLKELRNLRSSLSMDKSDRGKKFGTTDKPTTTASTSQIDKIYMYINLIPREYGLSESEYPEKWLFCVASDTVVISAERLEHAHGMYPVAVAAPEYDGYSCTPMGRLEILYGLQGVLDWMFNSHVANVRKAINDMLVVDPYLVNINDLKDPQPGKLIRLRRSAWGKGVDKVVQQLTVNDITRQNIADSAYITQWMDRISGADQSMSGALRMGGPERLTRSEFQGTRGSAVSRLQRIAMVVGMQFMQDIGTMFAVHAQQYMERDLYVKIIGRHRDQVHSIFGGQSMKQVTPYDLAVNYDVYVRDGSIPGGNFSEIWVELFKIIGTTPELVAQFDTTRIFMFIATQLGAKNVEDFKRNVDRIQPKVLPDETVAREVEAGNLIPTGA